VWNGSCPRACGHTDLGSKPSSSMYELSDPSGFSFLTSAKRIIKSCLAPGEFSTWWLSSPLLIAVHLLKWYFLSDKGFSSSFLFLYNYNAHKIVLNEIKLRFVHLQKYLILCFPLVYVFYWSISCCAMLCYRCTIQWFTIFKGYAPCIVIKCCLYSPCGTGYPCSLFYIW